MIRHLWKKFDFFVEMIPASKDLKNALGLQLVDKKVHWNHATRRGIVRDMNANVKVDVKLGDVVVFKGSAGFTLDGDIIDDDFQEFGENKGESFRWLKESEILAVDEAMTEELSKPKEVVHAA